MAVVDGDLGDGAEHEAAGGCEIEDAQEDAGRQPAPVERLERPVELLVGVGGGHDRPDPGLVERDGREDDRLREDALLEQPLAETGWPCPSRPRSPA